jgi:hypothetical protein
LAVFDESAARQLSGEALREERAVFQGADKLSKRRGQASYFALPVWWPILLKNRRMSIPFWIALLSLIFIYISIEMPIWGTETAVKKWVFRGLFVAAALATAILTFIQTRSDDGEKADMKSKLDSANAKLTQQHEDFSGAEEQYKEVIRIMANSDQPLKAALNALAEMPSQDGTNNYFDPQNLTQLLKTHEATSNQSHLAHFVGIAPIADYAFRVVNDQCLKLASDCGDKLSSSYDKLPSELSPDCKWTIPIQFAANKEWKFDCQLDYLYGPDLFIRVGTDSMQVEKEDNGVRLQCNTDPDIAFAGIVPFDKWQDKYKELLALIFATQLQKHPLTLVKPGN